LISAGVLVFATAGAREMVVVVGERVVVAVVIVELGERLA